MQVNWLINKSKFPSESDKRQNSTKGERQISLFLEENLAKKVNFLYIEP